MGKVLDSKTSYGAAAQVEELQQTLAEDPFRAEAHFTLSLLHMVDADLEAARLDLKRAIALAPFIAPAYNNLASLYERDEDFVTALDLSRRAVLLNPADPLFQSNLASFSSKLDRVAGAVRHYRLALALDPGFAKATTDFAIILGELGRGTEASAMFLRAAVLTPESVDLVRHCVEMVPVTTSHPVRATLARLAAHQDNLTVRNRIELNFALGKSHDDLGETDSAFACWATANRLLRQTLPYDEAATMHRFDAITEQFSASAIAELQSQGLAGPRPIFIVGMPRSGSTLVDQILASHPSVAACGEIDTLEMALQRHGARGLRAVAVAYLAELRRLRPGVARCTDKMLGNCLHVGLIAAMFPDARIVHVRRDPLDTCLSNYSRLFVESHPYSSDLAELGRYYRRYIDLMAHWRAVLPEGRMIDVTYEELVQDLPGQVRRLLVFLDLPWDSRCLAFHETERFVRTASQGQVRQPLYRNAVGRWHRYAGHAGALIEGLGPVAGRHYMFGA